MGTCRFINADDTTVLFLDREQVLDTFTVAVVVARYLIKIKRRRGPDGWMIAPDTAKHAGSVWKLLNKAGKRIATLWEDGSVRGK